MTAIQVLLASMSVLERGGEGGKRLVPQKHPLHTDVILPPLGFSHTMPNLHRPHRRCSRPPRLFNFSLKILQFNQDIIIQRLQTLLYMQLELDDIIEYFLHFCMEIITQLQYRVLNLVVFNLDGLKTLFDGEEAGLGVDAHGLEVTFEFFNLGVGGGSFGGGCL